MPKEQLAAVILDWAHREDHRLNPRHVTARARSQAWIPGGTRLAVKTIQNCAACKIKNRRLAEQIMGDLPDEKLDPASPFTYVCLDLFGPFMTKDCAKGRRRFKCWGAVYSCLSAKAVCILPVPGYDAETFRKTHLSFISIYGSPRVIYLDHGASIKKVSEAPEWIQWAFQLGYDKTTWKLTPTGCSWRNGQAERVI